MKQKAKQLLSVLLSLCMLLSITAGLDFSAQAATGNEIVSYARQFIGYPYVYGTQGPNSFDCSGFVQYVFKHFGISLPASSSSYWNNPTAYGTVVGSGSTINAQAGDVISWSGHVAIYTENGRCVEALNANYGVTESVPVNSHTNGMNYKVIRINGVTSGSSSTETPPTKTPVNIGDDFYAYIIKLNSWKHLENIDGNVAICSNGNDSNNSKQIWHFIRQSDNSYKIINVYNDSYLDADCCGYENGTNVKTYSDTGSVAQKWFIYNNGGGYNIGASYCDKVLDSFSDGDNNRNNIQLYDSNNSNAQIFSIYDLKNDSVSYSKPQRPQKPTVSVSVNDKNITVNWTKSNLVNRFDKREYDIRIYNSSNSLVYSKFGITSTNFNCELSSSGKYKVTIAAVNYNYYNYFTMSDEVSFCVHGYSNSCDTTCDYCGATRTISHKYDSGKVTKQPTYTSTGTKTYTCTICGATKTSIIAATGTTTPAPDEIFADIKGYDAYADYITYTSINNSFIKGTNPPAYTEFSPTTAITRAMFVTILYRMAGAPYDEANPHTTTPFTDITNTGVYYYNAACWALDNGITTQTTFKPNDLVVREQTASFLFRYASNEGFVDDSYKSVDLSKYSDLSSVSSWAVPAMQWANQQGMITGTQQGTLNPKGSTLRIHATKILYGFGMACGIGNM